VGTLIIGGPTAAGKSAAALAIAEQYGAVIVSADAMTVYRHLDIGTAKPDAETLAGIPHLCINVRDPDGDFTVGDFVDAVDAATCEHEHVVVAGGTPFYLAALVRPHAPLPLGNPAVRATLETLPDPHARLTEVDPEIAARLHPNDRVRVIRALEVFTLTGVPMSEVQRRPPVRPPIDAEVVWLDRTGLRARIDARLASMMAGGYREEVEGLLAAGWGRDLKPMRSFAYRHIVAHILDNLDLDEAIRLTARDTWRLARKQRAWARSMGWDPGTEDAVPLAAERAFSR
jgi:tRNA dimethylallyltransferase